MIQKLIKDLQYPFGNPIVETFDDPVNRAVVKNMIELVRERIWLAKGMPVETTEQINTFEQLLTDDDITCAEQTVQRFEQLIDMVYDYVKQHNAA